MSRQKSLKLFKPVAEPILDDDSESDSDSDIDSDSKVVEESRVAADGCLSITSATSSQSGSEILKHPNQPCQKFPAKLVSNIIALIQSGLTMTMAPLGQS